MNTTKQITHTSIRARIAMMAIAMIAIGVAAMHLALVNALLVARGTQLINDVARRDSLVTVDTPTEIIPPTEEYIPTPPPSLQSDIALLSSRSTKPEFAVVSSQQVIRKWQPARFVFNYPSDEEICEYSTPNPFYDYRLEVTFTRPNGSQLVVPGYYAASGDAADTSSDCGNFWETIVTPDVTGSWQMQARMFTGPGVAVHDTVEDARVLSARNFFVKSAAAQSQRDLYGKGGLVHQQGERFFTFANGEDLLKIGINSPEVLLGYYEFDNTPPSNVNDVQVEITAQSHSGDYAGDGLLWGAGKGKNIYGALNYAAAQGMNAIYLLALNAGGDGQSIWPWRNLDFENVARYTSYSQLTAQQKQNMKRFDVSKLAQWQRVFDHMERKGLVKNFVLSEMENQSLLGNSLTEERKLFYRELVARFGYLNGLVWNIGEENGQSNPGFNCPNGSPCPSSQPGFYNTTQNREEFIDYIANLDAHNHPIVIHTIPVNEGFVSPVALYENLYGKKNFSGTSLQLQSDNQGDVYNTNPDVVGESVYAWTRRFVEDSRAAGHQWAVYLDEYLNDNFGIYEDIDTLRTQVLWPHLMAGGAGVEWYFGSSGEGVWWLDQADINWRGTLGQNEFEPVWAMSRNAQKLFVDFIGTQRNLIPTSVTLAVDDYELTDNSGTYIIYRPEVTEESTLSLPPDTYYIGWYNPVEGIFTTRPQQFVVTGEEEELAYSVVESYIGSDAVIVITTDQTLFNPRGTSYPAGGQFTAELFDFESDEQFWIFNSLENLGLFSQVLGRYQSNPGRLAMTVTDPANSFAFWGSPLYFDELSDRVYRLRFTVRSDATETTKSRLPGFALRPSSSSFALSERIGFQSQGTSSVMPTSSGKQYTHYVAFPGSRYLQLFFDVLAFNPDNSGGTVALDEVLIDRINSASFGAGEPVLNLTLDEARHSDWIFGVAGDPLTSAIPIQQPNALGITGDQNRSNEVIFGWWEYKKPLFTMQDSSLYKIEVDVSSSVSAHDNEALLTMPAFRIRAFSADFQMYSEKIIESTSAYVVPSRDNPKTFTLYMVGRSELQGQPIKFAFDYLYVPETGNEPEHQIILEGVRVTQYSL